MSVSVEIAAPQDDEGIRQLLRREPLPGRVQLAFCRDPDFSLGCAVTGDDPRILVARARGADGIVGVACRSVRDVFLDGREQRLGYLGQLRVDERFRGRWLLARGFAILEQIDREDPVPAYLASIVDGNEEAVGVLIRRRRRSYPQFREIARCRTLAIPAGRQKAAVGGDFEIRPASAGELPALARFLRAQGVRRQLSPVWTEEKLRALRGYGLNLDDVRIATRRGTIVGTMALWDQTGFKQSVVRGYSGWWKALAPVLPRIGQQLRSVYASLVCIADDDAAVFRALLREVYNLACARRADYLLIGLDARDPLLRPARAYRHLSYGSRLYLASWRNGGPCHEQLDDRPAYVDIATL